MKENNFKLADYLLNNRPIDLYPYIYFNMFKHWYDSSQEVVSIPTEMVFIPTEVVRIPTEVVTIPAEVIGIPTEMVL